MSTLFITHDLSTAYYLGGDIMVMSRGRVVEDGPVGRRHDPPRPPLHPAPARLDPSPDPDQRVDGAR